MKRNIVFLPHLMVAFLMPLSIAACGGKEVSVGTNGTNAEALRTVDPTAVTAKVVSCATKKQAHPNVCCKGGPNEPAACHAYINKPFHSCGEGFNTFPDPEQCCDLSNPASCERPPPPPPGGEPDIGKCGYLCPPGWYVDGPGNACCRTYAGPNGEKYGECFSDSSAGSSGYDPGDRSSPSKPPSAEPDSPTAPKPPLPTPDPNCKPENCSPGSPGTGPVPPAPPGTNVPDPFPLPIPMPPSICDLGCPEGFTAAINDPAICCQQTPEGAICFSQAHGSYGDYDGPSTTEPGQPEQSGPPVPQPYPVPTSPTPAADAGAGPK